jgi:hypothetical protein
MTMVMEPDDAVMVATSADLRAAVKHALDRADCTFDELAAQARTGHFTSIQARLAWVAIGDLYKVDLDQAF